MTKHIEAAMHKNQKIALRRAIKFKVANKDVE